MKQNLLALICLLISLSMARADEETNAAITNLPVTPEIEAAVAAAMTNCPAHDAKIHEGINTNGFYTLTGDLFHNGHTNALIDNTNNIILSEWNGTQWKAKTVISAAPIWNSPTFQPGWGVVSATKPFYLLSLQGYPILVVGADREKYGQEFTAILFDPKTHNSLDSVTSCRQEPSIQSNYIYCYVASPRLGEFMGEYFFKIENEKFFKSIAHEEFTNLSSDKTRASYSVKANGLEYRTEVDNVETDNDRGWPFRWDIETNNKPYASVRFDIPQNMMSPINTLDTDEFDYLVSKLTGAPFRMGKENINKFAKINVIGSPEAVKLLSP